MYTNERCIIFDESGNMGNSGRYFVIACIDTTECKALHNIMNSLGRRFKGEIAHNILTLFWWYAIIKIEKRNYLWVCKPISVCDFLKHKLPVW